MYVYTYVVVVAVEWHEGAPPCSAWRTKDRPCGPWRNYVTQQASLRNVSTGVRMARCLCLMIFNEPTTPNAACHDLCLTMPSLML